jgi:hypothetical protein
MERRHSSIRRPNPKACADPSTTSLAGQAQKEFFVNAGFALCDVLLHPSVEGESAVAPENPTDGECWLVGSNGTGAFEGKSGHIAYWQANAWQFVAPSDGMRLFDRETAQFLVFVGDWRRENAVPTPDGGQSVDAEARAAIGSLIVSLRRQGILPGQ